MSPTAQLTLVEELVLLALDDTTGELRPMPVMAFNFALAGALISELSLLNRVDTDPQQLVLLSAIPTGNPMLDSAIDQIASASEFHLVSHWLRIFSDQAREIQTAALESLVARNILRREERRILWVFGVRRYPTIDFQERTEVRTRLSALILGNDLPDPRDAILIGLLLACQLTKHILPGAEFEAREARIQALAKMDLMGREMAAMMDSLAEALVPVVPFGM